jgi:asparagine synthase (glutamine-hydrolysing)
MGVKPFYYHQRPRGIAFASEIKALLEDPLVSRRPDPRGIADFLFCGQSLGGKTLFDGVSELQPGHALVFEDGRTSIWPYWRPDYGSKIDRPDAQVLDEIGALLHDAVRIHVRSHVALGSQLSGGIDSGVITALTNHFQPGSKTFTVRSGVDGYYDETPQARMVARYLGTLHHESTVDSADLDRELTKLMWHMDMPMPTPGGFNYHAVARLEAEHVKVVMTGHGGDELFAGYPAQFQAVFGHQSMFYRRRMPPPRKPSATYRLGRVIQALGPRGVMDRVRRRLAPPRDGLEAEWVRLHCSSLEADPDLNPGFLESLAGYSPVDEYLDQLRNGGATEPLDRVLNHDLRCYLPGLLFMEDRASMAVSIESRTPLLDYRLAEYLARLPAAQRVRGLVPKWLLREAGRPLLPGEIVDRRDKIPFPLPTDQWLANDLGESVQRILASPATRRRGVFVAHSLTEPGFRAGHDWPVLSLELWFRTFIDGTLEPGTPLSEVDA